ncbi:MAG: methylated-DNA--[protein]-cysteine S-methyltransferase [Acutalibacteraceae bacterium]
MLTREKMIDAIYRNDKSYDGVFYYGDKSTKIYCMPSCTAKIPREKNIVLFRSKVEAEEKGYSPCTKCRPNEEWSQGVYDTELGKIRIIEKNGFVTELGFLSHNSVDYVNPSKITDETAKQIEEYIKGQRKSFDIPIKPSGTDFQITVWENLVKIPYGETRTYLEIARQIGRPQACKAVGKANNKNPLLIIIPCHRVIGSNNSLTGYAAGLDVKQKLLEIEKKYK